MSPKAQPGSLTTRLLISQIGVSVAMALTMVVVAAVAGPPLFEAHMHQAGHNSPDVLAHSEEAFNAAGLLALGMGLAIAAAGAIVVSVLITRRLRRSLTDLGQAAARISDGDYGLRVRPADSRELATLADSFNTMAGQLATVEGTRRRLLTDLAHEIRTPLASMEICVESLEDGAIEPGPEAWQILSSQIDRIARLADDLGQVSAPPRRAGSISPPAPRTPTIWPRPRCLPLGTDSSESRFTSASSHTQAASRWLLLTPRGSGRCWAISCRTPYGTPLAEAVSMSASLMRVTGWAFR